MASVQERVETCSRESNNTRKMQKTHQNQKSMWTSLPTS